MATEPDDAEVVAEDDDGEQGFLQGEIWTKGWIPAAAATGAFVLGVTLLLSGARPPSALEGGIRPRLWVLELSHLSASVLGFGLLILARGLQRRIDSAFFATVVLLVLAGVSAGLHAAWPQAVFALVLALAMVPAKRAFYRQGRLWAEPWGARHWIAVLVAVGACAALTVVSGRDADLKGDLLWQVARDADVPRSLRALVGVLICLLALSVSRLLRGARVEPELLSSAERERALPILAKARNANAHVALVGDKRLLFAKGDEGFISYGVNGRVWVAVGDPVGPPEVAQALAWEFRSLVDRHAGWTCFLQVSPASLPLCLDMGLTLLKFGEHSVIPLETFSLEGSARAQLRQNVRKVEKQNVTFEVVDPPAVASPLMDELEQISNAWLSDKGRSEKGLTLGYFDRAYVAQTPVGLVRKEGRVVAFANLWAPACHSELEPDLVRYGGDAPPNVMYYLFVQLMLWGKAQGFSRFSMGGAPFAGFSTHALAPSWHRLGRFAFDHGERLYSFRGVRQFKEKFRPDWVPRYLAYPGGLTLPRVLAALSALSSSGPRLSREN